MTTGTQGTPTTWNHGRFGKNMIETEHQLKEFAKASLSLYWQRQATFVSATFLAAYFVSVEIALLCYSICLVSEFFDYKITNRVINWDGQSQEKAGHFLNLLTLISVLSSISVVQFIVVIALAEGPSSHIGPLFFLFAAALYAAMNNCQVPRVLIIRMAIYTAVFVFIPVYDLWLVRPPIDSHLWKNLGVVLFVLYFVIECSRRFLMQYQTGVQRLQELRVERDRVSKAYEVQSQFISVVSHELRTPLTSVKGSLDLLNSGLLGALPDDASFAAEIAKKNTNRLATLIEDLLDFQKLGSGSMKFKRLPIDLNHFVREAVETIRPFGDLHQVSIRAFPVGTPLIVMGDEDRLMQVMDNVLSNAVKFSKSGGIVKVTLEKHGSRVRISVRDNGIGIPESSKHLVFKPFSQVDSSDKREFGGTGLGMSITKQILEAHNGSIDFISKLGSGTTFVIALNLEPDIELEQTTGKPTRHEERHRLAAVS
ncbi:MAG: HAMP domain-containing histidine kinase [Rhodobacteraceae bacterium]|nr:HAMP domain-containing histidine kinase [Paracoccaceae bacterium]